ncbi:acyl-CoA dehydrogenase [Pusillimonas sp. CC-YST705]|uniref:Acyl-CoA dehydrogenase n=1 Tax=Mesopusillimonas faecipullorum TaxID=2755040 RepID=A0ABS8CE43_9BURK|nr:acyl-CoA dehydrogenase [Mesopusillimonas faecipullorum]MCB5363849.1 acyl-CoA dehydrogenase [Mesopusillimonas faecipullorum]
MPRFTPPLRDLAFVLDDVLNADQHLAALPACKDISSADLQSITEEAGRFAAKEILPLNQVAHREGCTWHDGQVRTPTGFPAAYAQFKELGWPSLCAPVEAGGQGLPRLAFSLLAEMLSSCSHAFGMYACINHCASACLKHSASPELQQRWLPRLATGEVIASMCMTEPQAGSDIGLVLTRAQAHDDGSYRLQGSKIFASGAEQDLSDNNMHLVLARLPDAPPGSRGLSLFLVPKLLEDGTRNTVFCDGIEHKMGLHGSATCALRFEQAVGWLVGAPHRGLAAMFPMMNEARLFTGLQALGLSEQALQNALDYAQERRQGRAPGSSDTSLLIAHADVQRMLLAQKAWTEGARVFTHWTALLIDVAEHHPDAVLRERTAATVGLLTPIIKGFLAENAQQSLSLALQVFGGHGYVEETGIEQLVRDARVLTLYEGTTGIQAQDLLLRKVLPDQAQQLNVLISEMHEWLAGADPKHLHGWETSLPETLALLQSLTQMLLEQQDTMAALQASTPYLRIAGHAVLAYLWARSTYAASPQAAQSSIWHQGKLDTATYYRTQLLPEILHQAAALRALPTHTPVIVE